MNDCVYSYREIDCDKRNFYNLITLGTEESVLIFDVP